MALTIIEKNGLVEKVLSLSLSKSTREIAKILKEEDGVNVTFKTVANFIKGIRQERAEVTRGLIQETIQATVPRDLLILDELITQQRDWFKSSSLEIPDKLLVAKELRQTIATKLKFSGAEESNVNLSFENRLGGDRDGDYDY